MPPMDRQAYAASWPAGASNIGPWVHRTCIEPVPFRCAAMRGGADLEGPSQARMRGCAPLCASTSLVGAVGFEPTTFRLPAGPGTTMRYHGVGERSQKPVATGFAAMARPGFEPGPRLSYASARRPRCPRRPRRPHSRSIWTIRTRQSVPKRYPGSLQGKERGPDSSLGATHGSFRDSGCGVTTASGMGLMGVGFRHL